MHPDAEVFLSWKKIEKRIGELIATDQYLSQAEKDHYPKYVVTMDELAGGNIDGVRIVHLAEFLLSSQY